MFFSADQLYATLADPTSSMGRDGYYARHFDLFTSGQVGKVCRKRVRAHVKQFKARIVNRQSGEWIGKWLRPWDVVPALRNYQAPDGQFAVGVEVELGFQSMNAACTVASHIQHWKHITLDNEGGNYPLEVTFPPVPYGKFGKRCQVANYLNYLNSTDHVNRLELARSGSIGTHVNISKGGNTISSDTMDQRCDIMRNMMSYMRDILGNERNLRYFGRHQPYNYSVWQGHYIEFKMFKSTLDFTTMKRYVNVAVALADLLYSNRSITEESIIEALEAGYNKRV